MDRLPVDELRALQRFVCAEQQEEAVRLSKSGAGPETLIHKTLEELCH